jgi:hypothetical protein
VSLTVTPPIVTQLQIVTPLQIFLQFLRSILNGLHF